MSPSTSSAYYSKLPNCRLRLTLGKQLIRVCKLVHITIGGEREDNPCVHSGVLIARTSNHQLAEIDSAVPPQ
jgi:hypothetical protein